MNPTPFELIILGGGCAGLSLATYLAKDPAWSKKTKIIEPRKAYVDDRSWCFWEPKDATLRNHLNPLISHRWQMWRFSNTQFEQNHQIPGRDYCYVAAKDFYHHALAAIEKKSCLELTLGISALDVEKTLQGYVVYLSDGSQLLGKTIIDTRSTQEYKAEDATLWQIFYGIEIQTQKASFDAETVGLMDNIHARPKATAFRYTLPFTPHRALIETTLFTPELHSPLLLKKELEDWIEQQWDPSDYTVLRTEQSCLPMGLRATGITKPGYIYAGITGGAIRPATGYAFLRIQSWAKNLALALSEYKPPKSTAYSGHMLNIMDSIFLRVLQDEPSLGAFLFQALAERVHPAALVRFLSDEATAKDYWQIMKALPTLRFLTYSLGLNAWLYPKKCRS